MQFGNNYLPVFLLRELITLADKDCKLYNNQLCDSLDATAKFGIL